MKQKLLLIAAIAAIGAATFTATCLQAGPLDGSTNDQPLAPAPGKPAVRKQPYRFNRNTLAYQTAIIQLKRVKSELERSKDDFQGHRSSALAACRRAQEELEVIQRIAAAEAATKNAAQPSGSAPQEQQPGASPNPAGGPVHSGTAQ